MEFLTSLRDWLEQRIPFVRAVRQKVHSWGFVGLLVFLLAKLVLHLIVNLIVLYIRGWERWQTLLWIGAFFTFSYELVGAYVLRWAYHNLREHFRVILGCVILAIITLLVFHHQLIHAIARLV